MTRFTQRHQATVWVFPRFPPFDVVPMVDLQFLLGISALLAGCTIAFENFQSAHLPSRVFQLLPVCLLPGCWIFHGSKRNRSLLVVREAAPGTARRHQKTNG